MYNNGGEGSALALLGCKSSALLGVRSVSILMPQSTPASTLPPTDPVTEPIPLTSTADVDAMLRASYDGPVYVFKHSNSCPVSAVGYHEFGKLSKDSVAPLYIITVQTDRDVSDYLAAAVGVRHETPQAILIRDGAATDTWTHWSVRAKKLRQAIQAPA